MGQLDINKKLEYILIRNNIIKTTSCDNAIKMIHYLEQQVTVGSSIGLYGVGIEAEGMLHFIMKNTISFKIDVCFDQVIRSYKYKNIIRNPIVNPIEDILSMNVDYIILGSYLYREVFLKKLDDLGYQGKIIDLYSFLGGYIEDHFADYRMVYHTKQAYLRESGFEKIGLLQKLIKEYILLRDFKNAFYYIDVYIDNQYEKFDQYIELKTDINKLLGEIKDCISKRNKRDIIVHWIDALSYYDVSSFPFFVQKEKEGTYFSNAYTVMPWTTETTKTILFGEYPIEGKLFLRDYLSYDNAKMLKILKEGGYCFAYCGMPRFAKLFDEEVVAPIGDYDNKFSGSLQKHWEALELLCQSKAPMCILVHTLREIHEPFICGEAETFICFGSTENDWSREECRKQAKVSGEYIQGQLEFYEKFYKENVIQIYMSDHGRVGNSPMNENKIHIMLLIKGKEFKHECVEGMFSLVRFPELIEKIIKKERDWGNLTRDYVLIENLDAYSDRAVKDTLAGRLKKEEMYQCRGIVTLTDRYYQYADGKEYYFISRESKVNESNNDLYRDRIMYLKKLCGNVFIDIYQYDKFKYSRLLYEI